MKPLNIQVPTVKLTLAPACCIHWPIGDKDLLEEWVEQVKNSPHTYTVLMGDSLDTARTHYRKHVRSYDSDENSQEAFDIYVREETEKLAEVLRPIRRKILGTIRGNHYWEFSDRTNTEQYLCKLLDIQYLGVLDLLKIRNKNGNGITVYMHHSGGSSGARTTGGDANALARQECGFTADMYMAGHTHRRLAWKEESVGLSNDLEPQIVSHSKCFVRCGAFLKGFKLDNPTVDKPHFPAYAESASYRPTDLGWTTVDVTFHSDGRPEFRVHY